MACAVRKCVCVILGGLILVLQNVKSYGKDDKIASAESGLATPKDKFQWNEHTHLSWEDFKGSINAANDASAAATYCGIGIRTGLSTAGNKPEILVYNTFDTKKSWVRKDAKIQSILDHEQGHFDLCEIYTRKLRARLNDLDLSVAHARQTLMNIYNEVNKEYEKRQQAYEQETLHGTNVNEQKRWLTMIGNELENIAGL